MNTYTLKDGTVIESIDIGKAKIKMGIFLQIKC